MFQWESTLNAALPGASAKVTVVLTPAGQYDAIVTVSYNDAPAAQAMKSATPTRTVQLETLL